MRKLSAECSSKKSRVPRWCGVHSSRPVARVRPLLDLLSLLPFAGPLRAIFARAPGLPPTGKTYPTPRNSILPSTFLPVLLDQRFAIDPCLPSSLFRNKKVTALEPRTPHQPEKPGSCQRTIQFYAFNFLSQRKIARCKWTYFQSSAAHSQAHDRIWCSRRFDFPQAVRGPSLFCGVRF
jgi:hypothetical protein